MSCCWYCGVETTNPKFCSFKETQRESDPSNGFADHFLQPVEPAPCLFTYICEEYPYLGSPMMHFMCCRYRIGNDPRQHKNDNNNNDDPHGRTPFERCSSVPPTGIEPASHPPEGCVLSIILWGQKTYSLSR